MFILKIIQNQHASGQRSLLRALHRCGSFALNKELIQAETTDNILQTIKSAANTLELLNNLSKTEKPLTSEQVMQTLKSLFLLQKSDNFPIKSSEIISHPQFEKILRNLRKTSRTLSLNDVIEVLKILSYIGVSANTNIVHILLNFIRRQINDLTLGHVIFLEFLLKKFDKTPLIEALQIAIPIILQLQLKTQIDHENVPQLTELLLFASRNKISNQSTMSIVSALTLQGTSLSLEEARSVLWSLCDIRPFKSSYEKLVENCFSVLNKRYKDQLFDEIDSTLSRVTEKYYSNVNVFYNENFFNNCANFAIEMDVGFNNAVYMLKKFNKVDFVNILFLDYISKRASENEELLTNAKPLIYYNFVTGLSKANYIPKQWDEIKNAIKANPLLKSDRTTLPWLKFATELISLDCYHTELIEKIFSDDYLDNLLSQEQNTMQYSQLLLIYQAISILQQNYSGPLPNPRFIDKAIELKLERKSFPLESSLKFILGDPTKICTKVVTKYGQLIDHVIAFDDSNEPISINTDDEKQFHHIEDFQHNNHQIVGVLTFPDHCYALNLPRLKATSELKIRTLEALGIKVVAVNLSQWTHMPEKDKLGYLEREIRYTAELKCKK